MAGLDIENVRAGYRGREVLTGLSLPPIEQGCITAMVGPNGAGKTTLLRVLAGLLPASGGVRLDGLNLLDAPTGERARKVAFMPQFAPQRLSLTVVETVIAALRASPMDTEETRVDAQQRALETLDRLNILYLALQPFDTLSGGQRQLASLAQALVRQPRLLLLDEPTSALDLRYQQQVIGNVREEARKGTIVIMVLHDLQAAASWADTVTVLSGGRLFAHGHPRDVITTPILRQVYGIDAVVEHTARGGVHIQVE
ncbi:iron complex transport system ATP-binding protein [Rhodopseudomonas rhenobacensis]|uniref:Iron complex transport system ATP-binding protein n=1 Tax=Rhodopseudomonas rhenobacensis TaxID=87461 RepID=A0A7W7Z7Q8_9BRAD|nr:ABC transporter ATP-binding protein [Rhodopseudomonas rhenobacensis]MBB5049591.1 iron complex transport system ATP-binding protein [Rhodopseudomonas rhenobacensis]